MEVAVKSVVMGRRAGKEGGQGKKALALNAGCEWGGGGREAADGRARWAWWKYFSVLAAKMCEQ